MQYYFLCGKQSFRCSFLAVDKTVSLVKLNFRVPSCLTKTLQPWRWELSRGSSLSPSGTMKDGLATCQWRMFLSDLAGLCFL